MRVQSFFYLDCGPVIPECGFQCDKCVEEIQSVLTAIDGVSEVSRGKRAETDGIVVQYDSEAISIEDLANTLRTLPSFYKGRFVPSLPDA
jgi:copper chaperone CopZ